MLNQSNQYNGYNPYAYTVQRNKITSKHHTHKIITIDILLAIAMLLLALCPLFNKAEDVKREHNINSNTNAMQSQIYKYIRADKIGLGPDMSKEVLYKVHYNKQKSMLTVIPSPAFTSRLTRCKKVIINHPNNHKLILRYMNNYHIFTVIEMIARTNSLLIQQLRSNMNLSTSQLKGQYPILYMPHTSTVSLNIIRIREPLFSSMSSSINNKYINNPDTLLKTEQRTHNRFLTLPKRTQGRLQRTNAKALVTQLNSTKNRSNANHV